MINSLEWVTDNINIQHFILINSSSCSDAYFLLFIKKNCTSLTIFTDASSFFTSAKVLS